MIHARQDGRSAVLPPTRRGLSPVMAAGYVGVTATKFDQMVTDGRKDRAVRRELAR